MENGEDIGLHAGPLVYCDNVKDWQMAFMPSLMLLMSCGAHRRAKFFGCPISSGFHSPGELVQRVCTSYHTTMFLAPARLSSPGAHPQEATNPTV